MSPPLGAIVRGLVAGAGGTAAMTAYQTALSNGPAGEPGGDSWNDAPAPAKVAKRILEGVFHRKVSPARIPLLTNVMHWAYGTAWGSAYGAVQGTMHKRPLLLGPVFGVGVWAASYAALVPMGIYRSPWRYPARELATDLSYHLVYGVGAAVSYETLERVP